MSEEDMVAAMDEGNMAANTTTGYGILNVSSPDAYYIYGIWAIIGSIVPPLLYNLLMRGHETWGTVGYKFMAYVHFYIWLPVSLAWFITLFHKTDLSYGALNIFSKLSTVGPFVLYPFSCYLMFRFGTLPEMWLGWFAAGLLTAYTLFSIFGQIVFLPALDSMYWDYLWEEAGKVGKFENDLDSDPLPEDFNDWGYLDLPTEDKDK